MSFDAHIENRTPFDLQLHVQPDAEGQEVAVLMLSASFEVDTGGRVGLAEEPLPVATADVPRGDPARSSVLHDADIAPVKPVPEILLNARAVAPGGRPVRQLEVGLLAGDLRKVVRVMGDRARLLGGFSDPRPFVVLPLTWERAYGGTTADGAAIDPRNPVGIGHEGALSADPDCRSEAPNLLRPGEAFERPGDRPQPVGFGVVSRAWRPRLDLAGTYDEAWLEDQWPLPPADLDPLHHQAAPPDQRSASLRPGAAISLLHMTPEGRWDFRLPRITAPLRLLRDDHAEEVAWVPDTVIVEPDRRRVTLKARLAILTDRRQPRLREVLFGHVSAVLLSARRRRKAYLGSRGSDGTARRPAWEAT